MKETLPRKYQLLPKLSTGRVIVQFFFYENSGMFISRIGSHRLDLSRFGRHSGPQDNPFRRCSYIPVHHRQRSCPKGKRSAYKVGSGLGQLVNGGLEMDRTFNSHKITSLYTVLNA